jgi:hypothetical protein
MIFVLDQQTDGRARRFAFKYTGQNLDLVRLLALTGMTRGTRATPFDIALNVFLTDSKTRRTAINDGT